jgi:hypothetical protein
MGGVVVLEGNFDRLRVLSVRAEVDIDDDDDDEGGGGGGGEEYYLEDEKEGVEGGGEGKEKGAATLTTTHRLMRTTATISPKRSVQRPSYTKAVGDAKLAWQWVEGWRARLRKGGDVVEKARWEWKLDRQMREPNNVPVVVVSVPEVVGNVERVGNARGFRGWGFAA